MAILTKEERNELSKVVIQARGVAEAAAAKALRAIGVGETDAPSHLSEEKRTLRRALRAQARQLGDKEDPRKKGTYDLYHLTEKIAYDQWHRMLFARFLAENDLLISPDHGVAVSLAECRELAPEIGLKDEWDVAVRFAAKSLPQIFRPDDPAGKIELAPEDRASLRDLVVGLSREILLASDSLGWSYQFWQTERKKQVNESGSKIGADELPAVTQLFTEDYMVDFLLDNTLGAWWAGKKLAGEDAKNAEFATEDDLRRFCSLPGVTWNYLRFVKAEDGKWSPAAGTFNGWPRTAAELKCLDPCMGSGHFVVALFERLVALRIAENPIEEKKAVVAVIRDNLFGLEIDPRCTQIAAFNLALAAWRRIGHYALPAMNLACSGLAPNAKLEEWLKIAGNDHKLQRGMERLYWLFQKSTVVGSLIDPRAQEGDLLAAAFHELQPLMEMALAQESRDESAREVAVTAHGLAMAAEILASHFTLVATNVPYLGRGNQDDVLKEYCSEFYPDSQADLAACFVERCQSFCDSGSSKALVVPQSWLSQARYDSVRQRTLQSEQTDLLARLGTRAFETISGEIVNIALLIFSKRLPPANFYMSAIDVSAEDSALKKARSLLISEFRRVLQVDLLNSPNSKISLAAVDQHQRLDVFASALHGQAVGDNPSFNRSFWEIQALRDGWEPYQCQPDVTCFYGGRHSVVHWENENGRMAELANSVRHLNHKAQQWRSGKPNWGRHGVAIGLVGQIYATLYTGEIYAQSCCVIVPHDARDLLAIWCFAESGELESELRQIDSSLGVSVKTVISVPFERSHWQNVAAQKYPNGLPKPFSDDPTQWLFNGNPKDSAQPLHVGVARLLGYQWPRQTGSSFPDCPALGPDGFESRADEDGIACINPIKGEQPAAERLRALLAAAFGVDWTPAKQNELLEQVEFGGKTLEDWLRNGFFEQHCQLFHQRPFIWHIWDGRRDGFSALVNYHKLNRRNLEKLTFTFLGDWIARQKAANDAGEEGSDARLQAAQELKGKLEKIIEGEAPFDIFVRWKPLEKQPIGWEPDLNDGVRLNIRPFVEAGVLRKNPKINWKKDRGKDVASAPWYKVFKGERINDHHLTLAEKRKARG